MQVQFLCPQDGHKHQHSGLKVRLRDNLLAEIILSVYAQILNSLFGKGVQNEIIRLRNVPF